MKKLRKISKEYYLRQIVSCWLVSYMLFCFGMPAKVAMAAPPPGQLPQGWEVVTGTVGGFDYSTVNELHIRNIANGTIIKWNAGFNIGSAAWTEFQLINAGAAVMNRDVTGNMSEIYGRLTANGGVFIINPAGIVFGKGARINVSQLVASSLNIADDDFMNGIYKFSGEGGMVSNYGQITAEQVALIGRKVLNAGVIQAPAGTVIMAAGDKVFLGAEGGNVVVEVTGVTLPDATDAAFKDGDVINEGTIEAAGGKIVLASGDTWSRAVDGIDEPTVAVDGGTGRVGQFGTLNADGIDGDGGSITLTAGDVVALSSDSLTTANAGTNGDGGDVIVYSPDTAIFASGAQVEAKGGSESGDGGFVEISGVLGLFFDGDVDTSAAYGQMGTLLFDPWNIVIHDGWTGSNNAALNDAKIFQTDGSGTFHIGEKKLESLTNTNVRLEAKNNITMRDLSDNKLNMTNMGGAGRTLRIIANADNTDGGDFKMDDTGDTIFTAGGNIVIKGKNITVGRLSTGEKGSLDEASNGDITLTATKDVEARKLIAGDELTVKAGRNITASGIVKSGKDMLLKADDNNNGTGIITVGSDVETKQGDLTLNGDVVANGTGNQLFNANALGKQLIVKGTITKNTSGNLTLQGGRLNAADDTGIDIILRGDVTVNQGSLIIGLDGADDDTRVKAGVTLSASDNVRVKDSLTGEGALSLDAGNNLNLHKGVTAVGYLSLVAGNEVISGGPIGVTGSDLIIQQGLSIDTAGYTFTNQGITDLTLISDNGSVTSTRTADGGLDDNAADQWLSIGATADDNIDLSGESHITLKDGDSDGKLLHAKTGYIDVVAGPSSSGAASILASGGGDVVADKDVSLIANHKLDLPGAVTAGDHVILKSDSDYWGGEDLIVDGAITAGKTVDIDGRNVYLNSSVTAGDNMTILAHGLYSNGELFDSSFTSGGDVDIDGEISTSNSGNIDVRATRHINLNNAPTSANADGTLTLIANTEPSQQGVLEVDGDLFGNMKLSGYHVKVHGDVVSYLGTLDVDAVRDILLDETVSSFGAMTMDAGDDIRLNMSTGENTTSGSTMTINADDDLHIKGNVSANGHMTLKTRGDNKNEQGSGQYKYDIWLGGTATTTNGGNIHVEVLDNGGAPFNDSKDDIKFADAVTSDGSLTVLTGDDIYADGKLTSATAMTVKAGDDIFLYAAPASAQSGGTMQLIADLDPGNGTGNLTVSGSLEGNMKLEGTNVYVDGTVTSGGTLDVDADDDIRLKSNVSSWGDMTMNAGDNITLNQDGGDTTSDGDMAINAGGDVTAYHNLTTTGNNGSGNMLVEGENIYVGENADSDGTMTMTATGDDEFLLASGSMNGSIKIEGYAKSKYDMVMTATGGNKSLVLFDFSNEVMNGSIAIGNYAKSRYGNMTMSANGGDVLETVTLIGPGTVLMNGSICIGNYAQSKHDMLMTATGGSEGFDIILPDVLDFDGMNGSIKIGDDARSLFGGVTMTAEGGSEYLTNDETDIDLMNGSIKIGDDVTALGDLSLTAKGGHELLTKDGLDVDGMNGSILIGDDAKSYLGNVTMTAEGGSEILTSDEWNVAGMSGSIKIGGDVTSLFHLNLSAKGGSEIGTVDKYDIDGMNGSIWIEGDAKSYLDGVTMTAKGGSEILTYDEWDVDGMNGSIKIGGDVTSTFNMNLSAKGGSDILTADKFDIDGMNGSICIGDDAKSLLGSVTMTAEGGSEFLAADLVDIDGMNGSIKIGDDVSSKHDLVLSAKGGSEIGTLDLLDIDVMNGSIKIGGNAESRQGAMTMTAEGGKEILSADLLDIDVMNGSIKIGGHVKSKYDLELTAKGGYEFLTVDGLDFDLMNGSICVGDYVESTDGAVTLTAEGTSEILTLDGLDLDLMNGSIFVGGSVESQDDTIISAQGGQKILSGDYYDFSLLSGDVVVLGDIQSYGGNVSIYSSDDTTYLGGDVTAFDNVLLNNNTEFTSTDDQHVTAQTGSVTANGYLEKPEDGSLYLLANDNISLADHVTVENGGISIIAETGKIFTPGAGGGDDTLNVDITGTSDHVLDIGVDLPKDYDDPAPDAAGEYETGKAAIVIMSEKALKLGPDGTLTARGTYYDDGSVDDRPGVDFANYDRPDKPGGDPIDVAIYLASNSRELIDLPTFDYEGDVHVGSPVADLPDGAVMVVDAYDTVTFGDAFETSLDNGNVDWLEVCSRISPTYGFAWTYDKLPKSAGEGWDLDNYVWRGEGGGDDGGAWVLLEPAVPTPAALFAPVAPLVPYEVPTITGCPELMLAVAMELGITPETIQVGIGNALALNPTMQPCEACAALVDAASILRDEDGSRMAAMVQAFNALAPADAPFTPATAASIATAFEGAAEGSQYASAMEYVDAFVQYVAVLDIELGSPVGDDSVAFVMEKYGAGVTGSDNANIAAFVATRLEAIGQ